MDWLKDLWTEIHNGWPTVMANQSLFFAILTVGLIVGWAAAWLILKQRLTHHKEVVEQYRKDLERPRSERRNVASEETESYTVEVVERKDMPGAWTVEAIDRDGGIEQAIFAGPQSRERADAYARFQYGH
jgi:hypothetical protein